MNTKPVETSNSFDVLKSEDAQGMDNLACEDLKPVSEEVVENPTIQKDVLECNVKTTEVVGDIILKPANNSLKITEEVGHTDLMAAYVDNSSLTIKKPNELSRVLGLKTLATHGLAAVNSVPWDTIANYAKPFLNKVVSTTTNIVTRCLNRVCTNYMPYFFTLLLQLCTFY